MRTLFRIERRLLEDIHTDLSRQHPFAFERVGFIACRTGAIAGGRILLAQSYQSIDDDDYEESVDVGAMMSRDAIRKALQFAYNNPVSMLHVHRHEHIGVPSFSPIDLSESEKFIPDFWKVRPKMPHGTLVLSHTDMAGLVWAPNTRAVTRIRELTVVGRPIKTTRYEHAAELGTPELSGQTQ